MPSHGVYLTDDQDVELQDICKELGTNRKELLKKIAIDFMVGYRVSHPRPVGQPGQ